jgi:hypothetical protein
MLFTPASSTHQQYNLVLPAPVYTHFMRSSLLTLLLKRPRRELDGLPNTWKVSPLKLRNRTRSVCDTFVHCDRRFPTCSAVSQRRSQPAQPQLSTLPGPFRWVASQGSGAARQPPASLWKERNAHPCPAA